MFRRPHRISSGRRRYRLAFLLLGTLIPLGTIWILSEIALPKFQALGPEDEYSKVDESVAETRAFNAAIDGYRKVEEGDAEKALTLMQEAVEWQPNDAVYRAAHAEALIAMGRYDEAIAEYRTAANLEPQEPDHLRHAAMTMAEAGDIAGGIRQLKALLEQKSGLVATRLRLAALLLAQGELNEAKAELDTAIDRGVDAVERNDSTQGTFKLSEALMCRGMLRVALSKDPSGLDDIAESGRVESGGRLELRLARYIARAELGKKVAPPQAWPINGDENLSNKAYIDLLDVYRGAAAPEAPVERLGTRRDVYRKADLTILHYYLAEWFALRGDVGRAIRNFQSAITEGTPYLCEYGLAKARLAQLNTPIP